MATLAPDRRLCRAVTWRRANNEQPALKLLYNLLVNISGFFCCWELRIRSSCHWWIAWLWQSKSCFMQLLKTSASDSVSVFTAGRKVENIYFFFLGGGWKRDFVWWHCVDCFETRAVFLFTSCRKDCFCWRRIFSVSKVLKRCDWI